VRLRRVTVVIVSAGLSAGSLLSAPVQAATAAPTQLSPGDAATLAFPGNPPIFSWSKIRGAISYRIQIDDAPDFVGAKEYTSPNRSFTPTEPQTVGVPFYWRVQAVLSTGKNTPWSAVRQYSISWNSKPVLLQPANDAGIVDIVFGWAPVAGGATYQIQISPNGDWANNVLIDQVVKGTRFSPSITLPNGTYFWRVRARDAATVPNNGAWSDEWQFTRAWAEAPSLQWPPDQLSPSLDSPTFRWSPTAHASDYRLEVGIDPNFSPGTFSDCDTNHTEFTYYEVPTWSPTGPPNPPGSCATTYPNRFKMQPGQTYFWRVRGIDEPARAYGPWSPVWRFVLRASGDDAPTLLTPDDNASVSDPRLVWTPVPDTAYDVDRYQVTIAHNGLQVQRVKTAATSYTPTVSLSLNQTYTWYVTTLDLYGEPGLIAGPMNFTVVAPSSTFSAPNPIGPPNGSSTLRMPEFRWAPVTNVDHYEIWYGVEGSGVEQLMASSLKYPSFTYPTDVLPPGDYFWRVKAYPKAGPMVAGEYGTFTIADIDGEAPGDYLSPPDCAPGTSCTPITDTPTLRWNPVRSAGSYLVYLAIDPGFTNILKAYKTQYTELTPRESILDNQAGQAYYWFVRPCKTSSACGAFDDSVFQNARAFQKRSVKAQPIGPADASVVANEVSFSWHDYLDTNQAQPPSQRVTEEAKQYRIQVSTAKDFASILDDKTVDQTTYTSAAMTYPEGSLYWRVEALDGSGNPLTYSDPWKVIKSSPRISLRYPNADVVLTNQGVPYFAWTPQVYAARYEIDVYRNGDLNFSAINRVLDAQTKMAAWAPTASLPDGLYAWRVRRLDADGRPGPWSLGRQFRLGRIPTTTTVSVTRRPSKLVVEGLVKPPRPRRSVTVSLYRKRDGAFSRIARKTPTIGSDGGFATSFARPSPGSCKVVARFRGDSNHLASSDAVAFRC
jgi:hypothetical protein